MIFLTGHLVGFILRSRRTSADQRTSDRIPLTAAHYGEPIEGTWGTGRGHSGVEGRFHSPSGEVPTQNSFRVRRYTSDWLLQQTDGW